MKSTQQSPGSRHSVNLSDAVTKFPTPKSSPSGPDYARAGREGAGGDDLATMVAKIWPTPGATTRGPATGREITESGQVKSNTTGTAWGMTLETAVAHDVDGLSGQLNPNWVEWLMGYPAGWLDPDCVGPTPHAGFDNEPDIPRVATSIKERVHKLKGLGNAVVPQIPEIIGRAIIEIEGEGR